MVYYEIIETQHDLSGPDRETFRFTLWRLEDALRCAAEWVSCDCLLGVRRTASVHMWPDIDEDGYPDCAACEVAFMTMEW